MITTSSATPVMASSTTPTPLLVGVGNTCRGTDSECLTTPACKENLLLLGDLQEVNYPPPRSESSPFVSLQYPPKPVLKPIK